MKNLLILLIFLFTIAVNGCGSQTPTINSATNPNTFPLTLTDDLGGQVILPNKPQRIISLALASDEILAHICNKESIYGLSSLSEDTFYSNIIDFSKSIPHKYSGKDLEKIIQVKPDLVITASWADARDLQRLRAAGIPVYAFKIPDTIDDIRKLILTLGTLTGEPTKATALVADMDEKLASINAACAIPAKTKQLAGLLTDNLFYVYGAKTLSAQLMTICHIKNLADRINVGDVQNVGKERIVAANPDIIFLAAYSAEEKNNPSSVYFNDSAFKNLPAVKNHAVYAIPNPHLTAMSQYIVNGAADMAHAAYPDTQF